MKKSRFSEEQKVKMPPTANRLFAVLYVGV